MNYQKKLAACCFICFNLILLNTIKSQDIVSILNNEFVLSGMNYYPKVLNYPIEVYTLNEVDFLVGPLHNYDRYNKCNCSSQEACNAEILEDLEQIASWGFNSIRLCGLALRFDVTTNDIVLDYSILNSIPPSTISRGGYRTLNSTLENEMFNWIDNLLDLANQAGLKVILLTGHGLVDHNNVYQKYGNYLTHLSNEFTDDPRVLAYDLYNEVKWSNPTQKKSEIKFKVDYWYNSIRNNTSNLVTIGTYGYDNVDNWDAGILDIDFLSFHFYPDGNNNEWVEAELYFLNNTVSKPWIVGETGFSGSDFWSNVWGNEMDQLNYANFSYKRTCDCGSRGYSWWDYKETFCSDNRDIYPKRATGLLDRDNNEKAAVEEFINLHSIDIPTQFHSECTKPANYYNMKKASNDSLSGRIIGYDNEPIENAVIQGSYEIGEQYFIFYTFSKSDGTFRLYSDQKVSSLIVSGVGSEIWETSSINYSLHYTIKITCNGIQPTINIAETVGIGSFKTYSAGIINTDNLLVDGNGTTGGIVNLSASDRILINQLRVKKGGNLKLGIENNYHDCWLTSTKSANSFNTAPHSMSEHTIINTENDVNIYPNPSKGILNIAFENQPGSYNVKLYNIAGALIIDAQLAEKLETLELYSVPDGIYNLKIVFNGNSINKKIVISK